MRVSIVGSGAIGLTIAYRLAQEGIDVTVFEQDELASKSSWAGAGILPPSNDCDPLHPIEHLQSLSNRIHPQLSKELSELTGIDNEYQQCGGIYVARTLGEAASLSGATTLWKKQGINFQILDTEELYELEPALEKMSDGPIRTAVLVPSESQLRNSRHLKALIAGCQKLGVNLRSHSRVEDVRQESQVVSFRVNGERIESEFVCVASGAWTSKLASQFSKVQVVPIKGHMLLYRLREPVYERVINEANRYIVCRRDGHTLVGSSEEETGFDESTSDEEVNRLKQFATSFDPTLNDDHLVRVWTGLRPMAYDHLPFIGPHSDHPGILFATGHYRSGLHLSPGTAEVICNMVLGRPNEFDLKALRPER